MKVTAIKKQQSRDRYSIYIDNKYSFSLSAWQLSSSGIKEGGVLTDEDLQVIRAKAEFGKLYDRVLKWMAIRLRSEREIDDYLFKKTKDKELISKIKAKLAKNQLIDDQKFAQMWVANRRSIKRSSKTRIFQELLRKGVDKNIIESSLDENQATESEVLTKLIEKKRRLSRYQDDEKLMAYLARQGFRYGDIKEVLNSLEE